MIELLAIVQLRAKTLLKQWLIISFVSFGLNMMSGKGIKLEENENGGND